MPFFTRDHIRLALPELARGHEFLVSVLAMLRARVPVGNEAPAVRFGSTEEHQLLTEYFSPPGRTPVRPYYVPMGADRQRIDRWKPRDYGGTSLQRMRTSRTNLILQNAGPNGPMLHFSEDFNGILIRNPDKFIGTRPLSIHHLVAWMYRNIEVESHQAAIDRFVDEFHLNDYGLIPAIFRADPNPALSQIQLSAARIPEEDLVQDIQRPLGGDGLQAPLQGIPDRADAMQFQAVPANQVDIENDAGLADEVEEDEAAAVEATWDIPLERLDEALLPLRGVREAALRALAALRAGIHVIFTGPPGCGKTDLAQRICNAAGFPSWRTTATDSWSTFETVGGYFPRVRGEIETLEFEPGVVTAAMVSQKVLIIDEINRADIDKAFGELFTLLSGADVDLPYVTRLEDGTEHRVKLTCQTGAIIPGSIQKPEWWRIIGAMNDSDKASLKRLSFAFMRRFAFVSVAIPAEDDYAFLIRQGGAVLPDQHAALVDALIVLFASQSGLSAIGMPMGYAIPQAMISQILSECRLDAGRTPGELLASAICMYVCPQFQGRADLHGRFLDLVAPLVEPRDRARIGSDLANWTGYVD